MKSVMTIALACCLAWPALTDTSTHAQTQELNENRGAAAAWQAIERLRGTATVLHTTAHPDDEDGALLTWLARGQAVRTGLLTLNRGEGGANLIGPELYDALGLVRTEELLAAGRYYSVDQMFTRVADFGFSKRMDETLEHWGKDTVLDDVVRAVRQYRPDIIVSRFHGLPRDGHGNHQTAGLLSREVFRAAADPKRFPEHFREGLRPWQVKKLYLSVRESEPAATLKIDVGQYDPLLGRSYREVGREGLSWQRSQGAGQVRVAPGSAWSAIQLVESVVPRGDAEKSLFDNIDTTILGMARLANPALEITPQLTEINNRIEAAIRKFDAREPWRTAPELAAGERATRALIEKVKAARHSGQDAGGEDHLLFLLNNKEREFNDAMNKALGLAVEALVDPQRPAEGPMSAFMPRETFRVAIPGQEFSLTVGAVNRSPVKIERTQTTVVAPKGWQITPKSVGELPPNNSLQRAQFVLKVPEGAEYTRLYWTRSNELRDHIYQIDKPEHRLLPFPPPDVMGVFNYEVDGVRFTLTAPAQTVFVDRPWGERRRLLTVAPALNVAVSPRVLVAPIGAGQTSLNVAVRVGNNVKGDAAGRVRLQLPNGWRATPAEHTFRFSHEGEAGNLNFKVTPSQVTGGATHKIDAVAEYNGKQFTEGYRVIEERGLEPRHLYRPATIEVRGIDVKVAPNLNVGYVAGVGDEVPSALEQIGVKVTILEDLAHGNFDGFDAIIIGIRATAVRDDLKTYSKRLLDYVERGGNLIYQYQTQEFDAVPYGPYPYKLTPRAEEVSEEDAKVTVLEPANSILNWPNKIAAADFDGWVEERGSKWMSTWDERYKPLLESHDREQPPQKGGLMYAQYGKGTFVYAAYAFYRQLPAGVEGAYRLFANIISLKSRPK